MAPSASFGDTPLPLPRTRWNEDGLGAICNRHQNLCLGIALWNGVDPILKERLFGLNGHEGNHGEDAKEYWFHEDSTPTHSYMRMSYLYPMVPFPYAKLVEGNAQRGYGDRELELCDALGERAMLEGQWWHVTVEYAKAGPTDILQRITVRNPSASTATLHVLPTLWFRNTWSWGYNPAMPWVAEVDTQPASPQSPCLYRPEPVRDQGAEGGTATQHRVPLVQAAHGGSFSRPRAAGGPTARKEQAPTSGSSSHTAAALAMVGFERHLGHLSFAVGAPEVADGSGRPVPDAVAWPRPAGWSERGMLVTDNNTNFKGVWGGDGSLENPPSAAHDEGNASICEPFQNTPPRGVWFAKDGVERAVVHGEAGVKPRGCKGTKAAAWVSVTVPAGGTAVVRCRLSVPRTAPAAGGVSTDDSSRTVDGDEGLAEQDACGGPLEQRPAQPAEASDTETPEHQHAAQGSDTPRASVPQGRYSSPHTAGGVMAFQSAGAEVQALRDAGFVNTLGFGGFDACFALRRREADAFFTALAPRNLSAHDAAIQRQALAGLMWCKQYYHYGVQMWLDGDPGTPAPPAARQTARNAGWRHFYAADILSMPDSWEYPWFASWDLAFHMLPLALVDREWAKRQLLLLLRDWYLSPSGQLPAYEWDFGDTNPPVHAWSVLRIFRMDRKARFEANEGRDGTPGEGAPSLPRVHSSAFSVGSLGTANASDVGSTASGRGQGGGVHPLTRHGDYDFLQRAFHKLLLNFTWWVNRKDADGHNLFEGGFLGLDNIGVFNRSEFDPDDWAEGATSAAAHKPRLQQADASAWMAMFCLNMLEIAVELALYDASYEEVAGKFLEHFFLISSRVTGTARRRGADAATGHDSGLWDRESGFFYDRIVRAPDGSTPPVPIKLRSFVGLIPLYAVTTLSASTLRTLPRLARRLQWFMRHRAQEVRGHVRWWGPSLGTEHTEPCIADPDTGLVVHSLDTCSVDTLASWLDLGAGGTPQHPMGDVSAAASAGVDAAADALGGTLLLSLVNPHQLQRICDRMFDEEQFLSPFGLRSLSAEYRSTPFAFPTPRGCAHVGYEPGESRTGMFGGNSNWRGPVWMPVNYLMIESLQKFDRFFGDSFSVVMRQGSEQGPLAHTSLWGAASELSRRLISLFQTIPSKDAHPGKRPAMGPSKVWSEHPLLQGNVLFHEYFHGDSGEGLGASHQAGWTALVAKLIQQVASADGQV